MKIIHLSDLHLGKRVNEYSMLEDQAHILTEIVKIIDEEKPQAVIIAGDVYDKSVPSAEAVELFDSFLCRLAKRKLQVFVISGNHDSAERIAFGGRLMDASGVHMSPVYSGTVEPIVLEDEYGKIAFYMLPFIKPAEVRRFYPQETIESHSDAIKTAIEKMQVDASIRNVIVAHQFVTGAVRSDSEDISVGGTDNVDASVFEVFDYAALGHIHGPQRAGSEKIRYCGTPLKYSLSEEKHRKSLTVAELKEKGELSLREVELKPLRDLRSIRGSYEELTDKSFYEGSNPEDYIYAVLTDEEDVPDARRRLGLIYPNIMSLSYDNRRTRSTVQVEAAAVRENKTETELLDELYTLQMGGPMTQTQREYAEKLFRQIKEELL